MSLCAGMPLSLDVVIRSSIWRCHLNPRYHSMMKFDNPNMDMDMDIVHVVMNVHGYIDVCQGFLPYPSVHHQVGLLGSSLPLLLLLLR